MSLKEIILFLNRIRITAKDNYIEVAQNTLDSLREIVPLEYDNLQTLLSAVDPSEAKVDEIKQLISLKGNVKHYFEAD